MLTLKEIDELIRFGYGSKLEPQEWELEEAKASEFGQQLTTILEK